ncbi:MAG: cell wall hydrolase [Lachnospiraceae bacterium]|nr:cell wall hydrolase [Lachnospiraceae bacterium]
MRGRDMQDVYVVFQNFCGVIGNISKKAYRNCAVLLTGAAVVALISFNSKEFGGGGKNKTAMLAISNSGMIVKEEEGAEDEQTLQIEETIGVSAGDTENSNHLKETEEAEKSKANSRNNEFDVTVAELEGAEELVAAMQAEQRNLVSSENMLEILEEENQRSFTGKQETTTVCLAATQAPTATPVPTATPTPTPMPTPTPVPSGRVICLDDRNYQVLLRIVEAEAGGESQEGKMLVANVILNRVAHEKFPDSVEAVVFERCNGKVQFSPTADGRFDSVTISQDTIDAVEAVLCGADSSQGALFFSARSKADPNNMSWFDTHLKWLFACGGHEFYTLP